MDGIAAITIKPESRLGFFRMLPPFRFRPLIKRLRWGGTRLGRLLGKEIGAAHDAAESWEIADHGADQSLVEGGAFAGWPIARLLQEFHTELLGTELLETALPGTEAQQTERSLPKQTMFPLLVKFLDAHDRLSLQVHPNDQQARVLAGTDRGKTEAWVILDALPGSMIYAGLRPGIERADLDSAIRSGTLAECVHTFEAHVGDCFLIPAGTIHAIGEGILLAEIQQTSDVTFRLHDWGRLGTDGLPRPLHLSEALQCIDFSRGPIEPLRPRIVTGVSANHVEELVAGDYFVIRRHSGGHSWSVESRTGFRILMMLNGAADLHWLEGSESLVKGNTLLIPASCPDCRIIPREYSQVLEVSLPK